MPDAISPEALPGWPYKDIKTEEVTLLDCLLGQYGERKLTGVFGQVMLLWEALRHDKELVELLTKLRNPPYNDDQKNEPPDFSTLFPAPHSYIVFPPGFPDKPLAPWFPDIPFLSLKSEYQKELVEKPGQPAFEIGSITMLENARLLERFKQLAKEARETHQFGERHKHPAILKREKLNPGESVYDAIFTIRAHMGVKAVREAFEAWLKDNRKLFPEVDTIARRQWEDPRPILRDLAILRLVKLYDYHGARAWTKEHRPHEGHGTQKSDYAFYFGEGKKPKGRRPIYERQREFENAVRRALDAVTSLKPM